MEMREIIIIVAAAIPIVLLLVALVYSMRKERKNAALLEEIKNRTQQLIQSAKDVEAGFANGKLAAVIGVEQERQWIVAALDAALQDLYAGISERKAHIRDEISGMTKNETLIRQQMRRIVRAELGGLYAQWQNAGSTKALNAAAQIVNRMSDIYSSMFYSADVVQKGLLYGQLQQLYGQIIAIGSHISLGEIATVAGEYINGANQIMQNEWRKSCVN